MTPRVSRCGSKTTTFDFGYRFSWFDKLTESGAVVLVDDGKLLKDRMAKAHVAEEEILMFARQAHGLESMRQVKYAVLEKSGGITIVPN